MGGYFKLLKSWCDKLISFQITEIKDKNFYGGILCPACSMIHGRIGDAVYPFTLMYDKTGDKKYLEAAKMVIDWSEHNVRRKNGGYYNDKCNGWLGISAFSAEAIGDALFYHGKCLDSDTFDKWSGIFLCLTDFVYEYFENPKFKPNINYFAGEAALMALAYRITGNKKYLDRAHEKYLYVKGFFTEQGLLSGEGPGGKTEQKKCIYADLGYNVEESLPLLIKYAHLSGNDKALEYIAEKFKVHIEFMLPDGAWDNSWGTRANKWTYWGSRTSDGACSGLFHIAHLDGMFAEAAQRSFELLEKCSDNGNLYGGLMYSEYGEDACNHHAFCHAKALAAMIDSGFECTKRVPLPRDLEYGIKCFPDIHVNLISQGSIRATVSDCDAVAYDGAAVTGGTVSMLWSEKAGVVLAAVMARYNMTEPRNMQLSRNDDSMPCCALRINCHGFESINDKFAAVTTQYDGKNVKIHVSGTLRDTSFDGHTGYEFTYIFGCDDTFTVTAKANDNAVLIIPVICYAKDRVYEENGAFIIEKENSTVIAEGAGGKITAKKGLSFRNFTVIGGFASIPLEMALEKDKEATVKIRITDK